MTTNRDISRRLVKLEADRHFGGVRYVVSDRPLTEAEWDATKDGGDAEIDEPAGLSPILTEAEWVARFCAD